MKPDNMKPNSEAKILREYLKIMDDPDGNIRKFRRYAQIAMTLAMLFLFFCLSDNIHHIESVYYIAVLGFLAGTAFGLGIWFIQAVTQTKLLVAHMSKESIASRIEEIIG